MHCINHMFLSTAICAISAMASQFHVCERSGNDANDGSARRPFKTISASARAAQPGDVITVREGVYRERVNPPRGGESESRRIVYQAAPGAKVEIKGSEVIKGWVKDGNDVWRVVLPNAFFGDFNPYRDLIRGDWFDPRGRQHHTGAVYLNGEWLTEAASLDDIYGRGKAATDSALWFATVDDSHTTIWAQFKGVNPNEQLVEINVRRTVFYPDRPGRNYITVRGFTMRHAATPWAPPTAEQIGLIGTHWSKGWIIENNTISHSTCSGISLGKYGDQWDNTSANTAEGYVKTIVRALANGWHRDNIGHHIVRNNIISHCEQAGIVGSLGAAFCTVSDNTIHHVHVRRLFSGAEMAGIKFHAAIDTTIRRNHIYQTCLGLWLDWMAQGTRVTQNLFHDNAGQDLFVEVNHGPFVVDNNLFLSPTSLLDMSEGGAYAHNLFGGRIINRPELGRETPWHPAHSTAVAGLAKIHGGDNRFYNNIFIGKGTPTASPGHATTADPQWAGGYGLWVYDFREFPIRASGNVYCNGARPWKDESARTVLAAHNPAVRLHEKKGSTLVDMWMDPSILKTPTSPVTTQLLGKPRISNVPYVNPDSSAMVVDKDHLGKSRSHSKPTTGPFEKPGKGRQVIRVR